MGSSKKHKEKDKESSKKKRKHRSRSRSKERERKKRHRDRSPDDDVTFVKEDNLYSESREYQQQGKKKEAPQVKERNQEEPTAPAHGDGSSLSIEETNRLRIKLGLKPLDTTSKGDPENAKSNEVHAPAINLGDKRKTDALREKVATRKAERQLKSKLKKVKGLGDSDSDDDTLSWVLKSRKNQKEKELAEKRAKMLEDMDADFGVGSLVDQEFKKGSNENYSSKNLKGLKVEHTLDKFTEGRNVILTLKDKGILDEEDDDVLVNVNIEDDERAEKNVDNKKKKPDYKPYDEPQYDEYGMVKDTNLLSKYDEEIDGTKKESFTLDQGGSYNASHEKRMAEIKHQLRAQGQSLTMAAPTLATEYLTKEEVESASFKKVKKKVRKIRKKGVLKASDLLPLGEETSSQDYGSRARGRGRREVEEGEMEEGEEGEVKPESGATPREGTASHQPGNRGAEPDVKIELDDYDMAGPEEDLTGVMVEEEAAQNELTSALMKARRLKLKQERKSAKNMIENLAVQAPKEEEDGTNIILNATSEFCRNLGEIPTYGLAGNREEDRDELMDAELELMEQRRQEAEQEEMTGGWNAVDIDENPVHIEGEDSAVLEEEPIASDGIGAALQLAVKKGFLEVDDPLRHNQMSEKAIAELQVQNYTIQDKRYDDLDEKNRKRDRYAGGMTTDFKEKSGYKPEVHLDYVDEGGRHLSQKEAFRQLSHRFHGKGSGKKKTEKRGKKVEEELLMKQMSSTDTPLNTLSLLKDKQKSEKSPYIMLSGNKGFSANSIMKSS